MTTPRLRAGSRIEWQDADGDHRGRVVGREHLRQEWLLVTLPDEGRTTLVDPDEPTLRRQEAANAA